MQRCAAQQTCSGRSEFLGSTARLRGRAFTAAPSSRGALQVQNAISRQKKEEIVTDLKQRLEKSTMVFSVRFNRLSVATQQKIRKGLPDTASALVCKNTLMRVAAQQVGKEVIGEKGCKGDNLWIFVPEDAVKDTVKFWFKFEDDLYKDVKANAPKGEEPPRPTSVVSAFLEKSYLTAEELKKCESMPTKLELMASIAGLIKQVPTKLGRSINALPNKVAYAVKAVSELDEDKSKLTIDAVKPAAS